MLPSWGKPSDNFNALTGAARWSQCYVVRDGAVLRARDEGFSLITRRAVGAVACGLRARSQCREACSEIDGRLLVARRRFVEKLRACEEISSLADRRIVGRHCGGRGARCRCDAFRSGTGGVRSAHSIGVGLCGHEHEKRADEKTPHHDVDLKRREDKTKTPMSARFRSLVEMESPWPPRLAQKVVLEVVPLARTMGPIAVTPRNSSCAMSA